MIAQTDIDMGDICIDTRRTIVRPMHARSLTTVYSMFKTECGKRIINNGWRAAGIIGAIRDCRLHENVEVVLVDPFSSLCL